MTELIQPEDGKREIGAAAAGDGESTIAPFLKWAGGKRWFVTKHAARIPTSYGTYIEPFLGAGSVYFHLRPRRALLGDANADLINAYRAIKEDWPGIQRSLEYHQRRHTQDCGHYYWVRDRIPSSSTHQASRLIYLNRTCFNGLYRVNLRGEFNVPRGTKDSVVLDTDDFEKMSKILQGAQLVASDFEALVDRATAGDFVFCDPPYTVRHNHNGFRKYNERLFSWADQERLAKALFRAAKRKVKILCTNANHQSVWELYSSVQFDLKAISRSSRIAADTSSRGSFEELLISANI